MSVIHQIAFQGRDTDPFVIREVEVPPSWQGDLNNALAFLTPQWEHGRAIATELEKAQSSFVIYHTHQLVHFAQAFRTPNYARWGHFRHALPSELLHNKDFLAVEPFWQYLIEAMCGQAPGMAVMIERGLMTMRVIKISNKFPSIFGDGEPTPTPGLQFQWAHPSQLIHRYNLSEVALDEEPKIIEATRY